MSRFPSGSTEHHQDVISQPRSSRLRSNAIAAGQVATGFASAFALWAATAPEEAWDANSLYSLCVLLAGLVASFGRPRGFYWGILGIYLGQVVAIRTLVDVSGPPIFPLTLAVLIFGTLPAVGGAVIGAVLGYGIRRARRRP